MKTFFDYLARKGLKAKSLTSTLARWDAKTIKDFVVEARSRIPYVVEIPRSHFDFIANYELSGGAEPCAHIDCRLEQVDRLARFATLYGDHVALQDPFQDYDDTNLSSPDELAQSLRADLSIFYFLLPLFKAGLVSVVPRYTAFCENHAPTIVKKGILEKAEMSLRKTLMNDMDLRLEEEGVISVEFRHDILNHPPVKVETDGPLTRSKYPGNDGYYRVLGQTKRTLADMIIRPILLDLIQQDIYSAQYQLNYLTNRTLDMSAFESTNSAQTKGLSQALVEGFSHSLPFLQQIHLDKLLKLRREEGESFQVYRDTLAAILKALKPADTKLVKQAFEDTVLPEIHKIASTVKNARRLLQSTMTENIVFGAGLLTIGLASGFLSPDISRILTALGGFQFGINALRSMQQLVKEPAEIRDNRLYFLWKVQQDARQMHP